ncbi:hypothetical protein, partial [Halopseudomonas aestusnigri]|uniref:hypothetical protein n=1 Tax=Halopseudomonas aestusnigri TaxID=857252 RepID=UPI003003537A
ADWRSAWPKSAVIQTFLSNGSSEAALKVIAPAKEGSLEIIFAILADPVTTVEVMKNVGIGVATAITSTATAMGVLDRLKDKKIDRVVLHKNTGKATIYSGDETIETSAKVANLVSSKDIRQALHKVIQAPLKGRESAAIKFVTENETTELGEAEIAAFNPIRSDIPEKETTTSIQRIVRFTKLNFNSKRGWTVQSGDGFEASVTIKDEGFLNRVLANEEAFQKDKRYTVEIEKTETVNISGTHVKYAIIRVINEID